MASENEQTKSISSETSSTDDAVKKYLPYLREIQNNLHITATTP